MQQIINRKILLWIFVSMLTCCLVLAQVEPSTNSSKESSEEDPIAHIISEYDCPSPLTVWKGPIKENQICLNNCCLACPFANNFYPENKIKRTYQIFAIMGIFSFFLTIVLCTIFIVLPSQRQNPLTKLILLPLALSVMY